METAEAVVAAAWGTVALKVVLIHAAKGTEEHRRRRDRIFRFISGKPDVSWAQEERNKKNAMRGIAMRRNKCDIAPMSLSVSGRSGKHCPKSYLLDNPPM